MRRERRGTDRREKEREERKKKKREMEHAKQSFCVTSYRSSLQVSNEERIEMVPNCGSGSLGEYLRVWGQREKAYARGLLMKE